MLSRTHFCFAFWSWAFGGVKSSPHACNIAVVGDCHILQQAVCMWLSHDRRAVRLQGRSNEDTSALIEAVNKTGKAFLITTDLAGQTVARIACGGFMTQVASGPSVGTS